MINVTARTDMVSWMFSNPLAILIDIFVFSSYLVVKMSWTGRGRGRGSYQTEAPRGRFGARSYARGGAYEGSERDYNRSRGNGFYRPTPRQDRGLSGQQASRIGQSS